MQLHFLKSDLEHLRKLKFPNVLLRWLVATDILWLLEKVVNCMGGVTTVCNNFQIRMLIQTLKIHNMLSLVQLYQVVNWKKSLQLMQLLVKSIQLQLLKFEETESLLQSQYMHVVITLRDNWVSIELHISMIGHQQKIFQKCMMALMNIEDHCISISCLVDEGIVWLALISVHSFFGVTIKMGSQGTEREPFQKVHIHLENSKTIIMLRMSFVDKIPLLLQQKHFLPDRRKRRTKELLEQMKL